MLPLFLDVGNVHLQNNFDAILCYDRKYKKKKCGSAIRMRKVKMAVLAHLSKHIERLHHISLDLELKLDELLGQLLFCLPAQLQHLPVW